MKTIATLLAIAALTLITSARAQEEESASPSPATEEQSSATIEAPSGATESTPAATPEEHTTTLPSPAKTEEPAATSAPVEPKKTSSPASTAKMPAKKAAAAVAGPDKGSPESNVKRLEQEWEMSIMKHDASFAQARIAEDFMGCSSKGKRINKSGLIKEIKGDTDTYSSAKNGNVTVRAYGANVAVATGTSKEVGKAKDGKPFSRTYAWTDTWMLRGTHWQCIASQAMLLSGK